MAYFVEENNGVFSLQLIIFSEELADFLALLGFDAAEETEAVNDAAFMAWLVKCAAISAKYKLAWTAFLDLARTGSATVLVLTPPEVPVFDPMPTLVLPGIQKRFTQKAAKAKANPNCSENIQKTLGIFTTPDGSVHLAPDLTAKEDAGYPQLYFHKYGYATVNIYRNTGTGYGSTPFKTLTKSPYLDTDLPAIGVSGQYKYKAIYVVNDVETGNFSAEVSVNVMGR